MGVFRCIPVIVFCIPVSACIPVFRETVQDVALFLAIYLFIIGNYVCFSESRRQTDKKAEIWTRPRCLSTGSKTKRGEKRQYKEFSLTVLIKLKRLQMSDNKMIYIVMCMFCLPMPLVEYNTERLAEHQKKSSNS